jgi:hypothetical protein
MPPPRVVAHDFDAWHVLGETPDRARSLGAGPSTLVSSGLAVENDWVGGFVEVPADDCLLAYARGAPSVTDVDVVVYSEDGSVLVADEGRDVHPTVVLCAPHPPRVYVAAHVAEGEGLVSVGAHLVSKDRASNVAHTLDARSTVAEGGAGDAVLGIDEPLRRHYLEMGGRWEEIRRLAVMTDARVPAYVTVTVDGGRCVDAFVVPGDDLGPLDVEILDSDGRALARSLDGAGPRTLVACSPVAATGTLAVRPHLGRGLAAVVFARSDPDAYGDLAPAPNVAWFVPRQSLPKAKTALDTALASSGYATPTETASGVVSLGARTLRPVRLSAPEGSCSRVDVIAGEPLALVSARLWSESGSLVAADDASSSALLFACFHGAARLELEARGRPGPFALTVRPEPWKDPAFSRAPLAASRMLQRAASGSERLLAGKERGVRSASIDVASSFAWAEKVPAGACVRATAGVQGPGTGIELRAYDESDAEIDRGAGPDAATVRACAPQGSPRAVRFELRATAGSLSAVVGERVE